MKRTLSALAIAVLFISGGSANAAPHKPAHCKVLSVQTVTQSRNIAGMVIGMKDGRPIYGQGVQYQTVTTTTERCRGKVSTTVVSSGWHY